MQRYYRKAHSRLWGEGDHPVCLHFKALLITLIPYGTIVIML